MQFRSIRAKISFWAGLCLVVVVACIITMVMMQMRGQAAANRQLSVDDSKASLCLAGDGMARRVQTTLASALDGARSLAQTLEGIKDKDVQLKLDRESINNLLKSILIKNPDYLSVFTVWEPDALDGIDSVYKGTPGHDDTGRFIACWSRNDKGEAAVEARRNYGQEGLGAYYLTPKAEKKEFLTDPYLYSFHGKEARIASLCVPILVEGNFLGVVGIDLRIEFLQKIADERAGLKDIQIHIFSQSGQILAATGQSKLVGKPLKEAYGDADKILPVIQSGKGQTLTRGDNLEAFTPIVAGKSSRSWNIALISPLSSITAKADAELKQAATTMWRLIGVSTLFLVGALSRIWAISTAVANPVRRVSTLLQDIAQGEGDLTKRLPITSKDEVGELAKWFNVFVEKIQGLIQSIAENATTLTQASQGLQSTATTLAGGAEETKVQSATVAASAEEMSVTMVSMATSTQEMASHIRTVASAVEEMTTSISEVAKNAEQAAGVADNAASLVKESHEKISELGTAAEDIGKVILVIQDIAEQTNLLALNATIEAARAGEAGKGFAVVANEVKELAKQTAGATEDIRNRIENIQRTMHDAVQSIGKISSVINDVNSVSRVIASAVEEQSATTKEIAHNVAQTHGTAEVVSEGITQTATVSQEITKNIAGVDVAARQTAEGAAQTQMAGSELAKTAALLQKVVGQFRF